MKREGPRLDLGRLVAGCSQQNSAEGMLLGQERPRDLVLLAGTLTFRGAM